ncbi:MAG: deoxyribonuclease V [Dehalococcoidales bacterium]|nr:deoxyribonuclease V [Dehalococcoidales bacterium]
MRVCNLHSWDVDLEQAREIQARLSNQVIIEDGGLNPSLIAGLDVSVKRSGEALAAVVVLSYPDLTVREKSTATGKMNFPYIPGFLSFREIPLTLEAIDRLILVPDLVMVDGQGLVHPRRFGLACHLGLFLDKPTIGCAKSPLFGEYMEPGLLSGSREYIFDKDRKRIGSVIRTRDHVKPLFISVGHKISLGSAVEWVFRCCRGYRLPEPTRLAHLASRGVL